MPATETAIRDALATALDGASFSQPITAYGAFDSVTQIEGVTGIDVVVFPSGVARISSTRGYVETRVTLTVGIRKKLTTSGAARDTEIDELLALVEEIEAFLIGQAPDGAGFAGFDGGEAGREVYDLDNLTENNIFVASPLPTYLKYIAK